MFLFPVRARQKWTKKRGKKNRCSLDRQVFFVYEFPKFFTNTMKSNRLQKIFLFSLILFNFKALKSSPQHPTAYHLVFLSRHPPIRPLKHSQIKGFFFSKNTKLFLRPPVFFSSEKRKKTTAHIFLSLPALFTKKTDWNATLSNCLCYILSTLKDCKQEYLFPQKHKMSRKRTARSFQNFVSVCRYSRLSLSFHKTGGPRHTKSENFVFICRCSRLSVSFHKTGGASAYPNPKTSFSFVSALGFHYLCRC